MEMEWQDPPEKRERLTKWVKIFAELRDNPNRWARLYEGESHNAYSLAGRLRPRWTEFEIRSRKTGEKTAGVWARFVADEDEVVVFGNDVVVTVSVSQHRMI